MGFMSSIGGMVGGVVGGMFGGPIGAQLGKMIGSMIGQQLEQLVGQFGQQNVQDAISNKFADSAVDKLKSAIMGSPFIPKFEKDNLCQALDFAHSASQSMVPAGCQTGVNDAIGDVADKFADSIRDSFMQQVMDENKEAGEESRAGESGGGKGGSGGKNWLQLLAGTFANMQADHLDKAMKAQDRMQGADKDDQKAFMEANQEFQVQMQMFKMVSESASNALKSIGDALSSMVRKQ